MPLDLDPTTLVVAMVAAFVLAVVSAVAGFGGAALVVSAALLLAGVA